MNKPLKSVSRLLFAVVLSACAATPVFACTACFGQSDSEMAQGMNWGIYTLLGVIGVVLVCIATTFVVVGRRFSQHSVSRPPVSKP